MTTVPARHLVDERGTAGAALTALDLFAGAGGLSTGLSEAGGVHTVQAVELDVEAAATFAANHPSAEVFAGTVEDWLHTHEARRVDVVVGGPPCQGFSALGKRDVNDVRNKLWRDYARTVARTSPQYFVMENVAAFLKSVQFGELGSAFEPGGLLEDYRFEARVLNAADFGAPQSRRRGVVIGHHRDVEMPGFPEPTHQGDARRTVRDAFRGLPHEWDAMDLPQRTTTFQHHDLPGVHRDRDLHIGRHYSAVVQNRIAHIPPGGNRFDIPEPLLPPCWRRHHTGASDVMGRLHWDKPAVTIRTEFYKPEKGRYLHPSANRAITHLEAARLQGFPTGFKWVGSRSAVARQIGNAVPIALGAAIGRALRGQNATDEPAITSEQLLLH